MRMMPDYKLVDREARKLLRRHKVTAAPVPLVQIVRDTGAELHEVDFAEQAEAVSGVTDFNQGRIFVNTSDPTTRKKFTIAHELGHWVLHRELFDYDPKKYGLFPRDKKPERNPVEKEANAFAARILVPRFLLDQYEFASDYDVAEAFGVSEEVIRNRREFEYSRGRRIFA